MPGEDPEAVMGRPGVLAALARLLPTGYLRQLLSSQLRECDGSGVRNCRHRADGHGRSGYEAASLLVPAWGGDGVLGWVPCSRSVVSLDPLPQ